MAQLSGDDKRLVIEICDFFYPGNPPASVTDELAELAAEMLHEALKASKALDSVPRPAGFKPGIAWLVKEAVKAFWRTTGKQKIYEIARRTVALKYRSAYELAKAGA
jgi:hypothetical protein